MDEKNQALLENSFGGKAVGLKFNPSNNKEVQDIKEKCAVLINDLSTARSLTADPEKARMYSVAITELQTAQMWGVKAATWGL